MAVLELAKFSTDIPETSLSKTSESSNYFVLLGSIATAIAILQFINRSFFNKNTDEQLNHNNFKKSQDNLIHSYSDEGGMNEQNFNSDTLLPKKSNIFY